MGVKISELDAVSTMQDGCCLPIVSNGETRKVSYGTLKTRLKNDLALSDFNNDEGFIDNAVNDLLNYYLKTETYTKTEVNQIVNNITKVTIQIVDELPETGQSNVIYFVPKTNEENNVYDEYIYINDSWELIGNTDVDLSSKQDLLVSGENIKTINGSSILGSGNIITKEVAINPTQPTNNEKIWVKESKNLFDKNNANTIKVYISGTTITADSSTWSIYIPCKPNTTYTIQKNLSNFAKEISSSASIPVVGGTVSNVVQLPKNTPSIMYTTSSDANYLLMRVYNSYHDTSTTLQDALDSLMIEEGSVAHDYEPYINTPSIKANINGNYEEIYSKPVVLWENPHPTWDFEGQTITLNDNINNYKYYEIMYKFNSYSDIMLNTGKIITDYKAYLSYVAHVNYKRNIGYIGGTSIDFGEAAFFNSYNNSTPTVVDNYLIPYQVIGYNKKDNVSQQTPALSMTPPSQDYDDGADFIHDGGEQED